MRLLHCSDFHGHDPWFRWFAQESRRFDLVCLTGDLLDLFAPLERAEQIARVSTHLQSFATPLAVCSGNHDEPDDGWLRQLPRAQFWTDGDQFNLKGHAFRCIGWQQPLPAVAAADEIWLVHAPPDDCATSYASNGFNRGDFELGELGRSGQGPRIALSGHVHDASGWKARVGQTWSFNPGVGQSTKRPNAIEIDLTRNVAFHLGQTAQGLDVSRPLPLV